MGRRRVGPREWCGVCGATVGFTLAHLAAASGGPVVEATLQLLNTESAPAAFGPVRGSKRTSPVTLSRQDLYTILY